MTEFPNINFFTSCASNYLPMARVLANSVRTHHPKSKIILLLCDRLPDFVDPKKEPFDEIIQVENLPIPDKEAWIFKHTLVELCTGAKGIAFQELFRRFNFKNLVYLDPDIVLFSPLKILEDCLTGSNIILTPHIVGTSEREEACMEELAWMASGIYNLGFLAVKNTPEGHRFLAWWAKRCYDYAYCSSDDKLLFYDQPFVNYAPSFFDGVCILRDPSYNAAFWNIMRERKLKGSLKNGFSINGQPLTFFHFSHLGYDEKEVYGYAHLYGPEALDLTKLYLSWLNEAGRSVLKSAPWFYGCYQDGKLITNHQRMIYRQDPQLQLRFPNPFQTHPKGLSYKDWYQKHYSFSVLRSGAWSFLKKVTRPIRKGIFK